MGIEAATLSLIAVGVSAAGAGTAFYGAQQQAAGMQSAASATRAGAKFNAAVRNRNAIAFEQQADALRRATDREIIRFRNSFGKVQARTSTVYRKAGGVQSMTGTPLEILMANANQADEEAAFMDLEGRTKSGQLRERALNERLNMRLMLMEGASQARAFDTQARSARTAGYAQLAQNIASSDFRTDLRGAGLIS